MQLTLTHKTALVTGASSGLGAHFAHTLAEAGAHVVLAARRTQRLQRLEDELKEKGHKAHSIALDVTDADKVEEAIAEVAEQIGPIDVLINNAGVANPALFLDTEEDNWQQVLDTNLSGVYRVARAVAKQMVANEVKGSIVNIASILGLTVQTMQSSYAVSKAGVVQLTNMMALELSRHGIRVNAIAPGYFVTEMNDAFLNSAQGQAYLQRLLPRRAGRLQELDAPLLLLASDAGSYLNGVVLPVDGGTLLKGC